VTQPIQEPLTQRSISKQTWDTNQLYRRPPITSSDNRPWIRVSKPFPDGTFYPNQVIANNTNETLEFDEVYNIDPGESGEGFFSTVGAPINTIVFEVQGVYAITAELLWTNAANFPWAAFFSGDTFDWTHRHITGYQDTLGAETALGSGTLIHRYEANDGLELHVYQRSGGNRTLTAFYMEAVYMGSWSGIAFNDIFPRE
jgi:hypothetical protein